MKYSNKNAVIYGLVINEKFNIVPMGSLFDALDYFFEIYEWNKDSHLLLHIVPNEILSSFVHKKFKKQEQVLGELKEIIQGRYLIDSWEFLENIDIVDLKELFINNELDSVLSVDLITPLKFKNFMCRAKNIYIIPEYTDAEYLYQSKINNVQYYTEMPFCYSDVPYKMKFNFKMYKPIKKVLPDVLYVNYPKIGYPCSDAEITERVKGFNKPILTKDASFLYDLHNHFNEYIYFQSRKWFDPHPRLFHECKYYNKKYQYWNPNNIKDGSYFRYHDSLSENITSRELHKTDEIIQRMT